MEEDLHLGAADAKRVPKGKGGGLAALGCPAAGACGREGRHAAPWSALSWEEGPRQSAPARRGHTRGGNAEEGRARGRMGPRMHVLAMVGFGCVREREVCGALGPVARLPKKRRSTASWAVERADVQGWRPGGDRRVGAAPGAKEEAPRGNNAGGGERRPAQRLVATIEWEGGNPNLIPC